MRDVRYALGALLRTPAFTFAALASLAIGIGANTAVFSVTDALLLRPLPVENPHELIRVTFGGVGSAEFTNPIWEQVRDQSTFLSGSFAYAETHFDLSDGGEQRPVPAVWVAGDYFTTLSAVPVAGTLDSSDVGGSCEASAVLSHGFWTSEFGGDPLVVGRTINLSGYPFRVAGVTGAGFSGFEVGRTPSIFVPLCARAIVSPPRGGLDDPSFWFLRIGGRLMPGVSLTEARQRIGAIARSVYSASVPAEWTAERTEEYLQNSLGIEPAANGFADLRLSYDRPLLVMMMLVALVLLIACANVANLLMARSAQRRREIAIRMAVGAGRPRLVRQLLTESLVLAILAGGAGILLGAWSAALLVDLVAAEAGGASLDLSLNRRVLAFTASLTVLTAIIFGLAPALQTTRVSPRQAMSGSPSGSGRSIFTAGRVLVAGQIGVSLALLVAAGLLVGTFRHISSSDPGFTSDGVLLVSIDLRNAGYADDALPAVHREILDRLREMQGVSAASASDIVPISGAGWNGNIEVDAFVPSSDRDNMVFFNAVSDDFFATLGTTVLAGREFDAGDDAGSAPVAVVNQSLARKFFGGRDPIGELVGVRLAGNPEPNFHAEVVGVVQDTKYGSLREQSRELIYLPLPQSGPARASMQIQIRSSGGLAALTPIVEEVTRGMNPRISFRASSFADQLDASIARERLLATLSALFGGLALLLSMVGLFGTISYNIGRRHREIGVRLALGSTRPGLVGLILREVVTLLGIGLLLGAGIAFFSTRLVSSFLYGLTAADPAVMLIAISTLSISVLCAAAIPAWRAGQLDPVAALREE